MAIIPLDQRNGYIWMNGEFIEWQKAQIHILTHSLHYSGAVYEGIRSYDQKIFKLKEHLERLFASAATLKYQPNCSIAEMSHAATKLLTLNNQQNSYIRPLIWRGSESLRINSSMLSINAMIACWEVGSVESRRESFNIVVTNWLKAHPGSLPPNCKSSAHYQISSLAQQEAIDEGYDDVLMLDYRGYIAEGAVANIFFVENNKLITPIADSALEGITRSTIIELAKNMGIETEERRIIPEDLPGFSECFMTGTAVEVKPVTSITQGGNKIQYNNDIITSKLVKAYGELVRK